MPYALKSERLRMSRNWAAKNRAKNRERLNQELKQWRQENREKVRAYKNSRKRNFPEIKILELYRTRIWWALKRNQKSARTKELLGMELEEFKIYIQGQFRPGMTWENYGPVWHIDHVRPCASFDFSDPEQQKICFRWDNLQPLFAEENLRKGSKYVASK